MSANQCNATTTFPKLNPSSSKCQLLLADLTRLALETLNWLYTGLVDVTNPDQYQVSTGELVPMLVKAVQELSAKNDALEARIAALESG